MRKHNNETGAFVDRTLTDNNPDDIKFMRYYEKGLSDISSNKILASSGLSSNSLALNLYQKSTDHVMKHINDRL